MQVQLCLAAAVVGFLFVGTAAAQLLPPDGKGSATFVISLAPAKDSLVLYGLALASNSIAAFISVWFHLFKVDIHLDNF